MLESLPSGAEVLLGGVRKASRRRALAQTGTLYTSVRTLSTAKRVGMPGCRHLWQVGDAHLPPTISPALWPDGSVVVPKAACETPHAWQTIRGGQ